MFFMPSQIASRLSPSTSKDTMTPKSRGLSYEKKWSHLLGGPNGNFGDINSRGMFVQWPKPFRWGFTYKSQKITRWRIFNISHNRDTRPGISIKLLSKTLRLRKMQKILCKCSFQKAFDFWTCSAIVAQSLTVARNDQRYRFFIASDLHRYNLLNIHRE